jgi:hypothetical protein
MAKQMTQKALRTNVYKGAERIAERDWQPIYKFVFRHGPQQITEHLAVPHYTKEKVWVLPGGIEATGDELVENGAHYTTTLLWPRHWTHGKQS